MKALEKQLAGNLAMGTHRSMECYKIRIAIASKGKGKRGGARVISHIHVTGKTVYLLSIYDKGEAGSIPSDQINLLLNNIVY